MYRVLHMQRFQRCVGTTFTVSYSLYFPQRVEVEVDIYEDLDYIITAIFHFLNPFLRRVVD